MAKKHKAKKRTGRRRRVGAASSPVMSLLTVGAGSLLGKFVSGQVATRFANVPPIAVAGVQLVGGFLLAKGRSPVMRNLGVGVFANGIGDATKSLGILNGVMGAPSVRMIGGQDNVVPLIGGAGDDMNFDGVDMGNLDAPEIAVISGTYDEYSRD